MIGSKDSALTRQVDETQALLARYAISLQYADIPFDVVHAAKVRVIDTFGALFGGYAGEPCAVARRVAAAASSPGRCSVFGTGSRTSPDLAAFVNGTTARYAELNDVYHWPGSFGGHPSDVVMPVFAAAEDAGTTGQHLITALVLAYEIYIRISDEYPKGGFDHTNFCCLASAVAAGKLYGLSPEQMSHCISMAVVSDNTLRQVRLGHLSMFKAAASGQAARAGIFAAILAREGMEGPHSPFEGEAGWFKYVANKRLTLTPLAERSNNFRIGSTFIKQRASCATTISSILAAEKVGPIKEPHLISKVKVEVYEKAKVGMATGEHHWNPDCRETADHSIPFVTAVTLLDGTVTPRSFDQQRRGDPQLRSLISKIAVISNAQFTAAYERVPVEHRARVTVFMSDGREITGESGGRNGDLSEFKTDDRIETKFLSYAEPVLGQARAKALLKLLWGLDDVVDLTSVSNNAMTIGACFVKANVRGDTE